MATEEQRDYSATIKWLQGMIKMSSTAEFENATSRNRAEPVAIWKARKYIDEHSREELSLTRVAKAVNMNANYLSENFKQVTGIKFVDYVAHARFKNACDLLRNTRLRISEIAFAAGFNRSPNSIAYSKAFQANRLRNIGRRRASPVGVGRIPMARRKKPEQMRSQLFGFLRILAIRVAFEANSMGAR